MLTVQTLPVFAHSSDVFLRDYWGAPATWHIAITEYVIISLLSFLAAACDSVIGAACVDSRMGGNGRGMLVSLASKVRHEVDDTGFLETICCSGLDFVTSTTAYRHLSELEWA